MKQLLQETGEERRVKAEETACVVDGHGAQGEMFPGSVGSLSKYMESRSSKYKRLSDSGLCLQACLDSGERGWVEFWCGKSIGNGLKWRRQKRAPDSGCSVL